MGKNIEMNILNSDGQYESLYPYTVPDQVQNLLNDDTKEYIGLTSSATPDDAFRKLFLNTVLQGKSALRITLQNQNGINMCGVTINSDQFCDANGNKIQSATTNDQGYVDVFTDGETTNVSINNYFEIPNTSNSWNTPLGKELTQTWIITTVNELEIISSKNLSFSKNVKTFDVCCIGGGGGGSGSWSYDYGEVVAGGGGGGGYVQNMLGVIVESNENYYELIVGAGGSGGNGSDVNWGFQNIMGGDGGTTSITTGENNFINAQGGKGAGGNTRENAGVGGSGNGNGGNGYFWGVNQSHTYTSPSIGTGYKFNDSSLGLVGGGGGGGGYYVAYGEATFIPGASPFGGNGGCKVSNQDTYLPTIGKGAGGGGGGGGVSQGSGSMFTYYQNGAKGADGKIYLRWTIESL